MASFEEQQELMENALARAAQTQAQGQARLEQAVKRVEELIPVAGEAVAEAMKASTDEAAKAHLEAMTRVAGEVATALQGAVEATTKMAQHSTGLMEKMDQASQRMVASEQKVEASLDALAPKVAGVREKLEKELGGVVNATATTEAEVRKMVATIRTSMTAEIEKEIRTKLQESANQAAHRIYSIGEWWSNFTHLGIYLSLAITMVAAGILGWWFGKHQLEEGIYEKKYQELKANAAVGAWGMKVVLDPSGHVVSTEAIPIHQILVPVGDGKTWEAMVRHGEDWYYRGQLIPAAKGYSIAEAYDSSRKEANLIKAYRP